jgi:5-methylcytosine-specific restriction endonuclease McrA
MLAVHGDRCLACGTAERIEVDHVVPVVRGGTHELANVQPLCRSCNAAKGARATDYRVKALYGIDIEEVAA